jgi:AraC family transcriptional regulator
MDCGKGDIGLWIHPDTVSGDLCYFFGTILKDDAVIPAGASTIEIPEAEYAVFEVEGTTADKDLAEKVRKTWKAAVTEWLENSEYRWDSEKLDFEHYLGEKAMICIPVKKK